MKGILTLCVLQFWSALQVSAQVVAGPDSAAGTSRTGLITIQTDVDSAFVFIDSVKVGRTPLVIREVQPGAHHLKIVHPDVTNWLTGNIIDSVQVRPGEEKALRYAFGQRYLILSVPSGAEVFVEDSLRGSTPYLLSLASTDSVSSITLRKSGYDSARVNLSEARRGIETVTMKKVWGADVRGEEPEEIVSEQKHTTLGVYMAGAITVGFGAAAAYFKIQADERNDQFLQNFATSSRSQIRVYDTASAICLVVAEAGFGVLTYFLLTE